MNIKFEFNRTKSSKENLNMVDDFYFSPKKDNKNMIKNITEIKEINIEEEVENIKKIIENEEVSIQTNDSQIIQIKNIIDENLIIIKNEVNNSNEDLGKLTTE